MMRTSLGCGLCLWLTTIASAFGADDVPRPSETKSSLHQTVPETRAQVEQALNQKLSELKELQAEIVRLHQRLGQTRHVVVALKFVEVQSDQLAELGLKPVGRFHQVQAAQPRESDEGIVLTAASFVSDQSRAVGVPYQLIADDDALESRVEKLRQQKQLKIHAEPTLVAKIGRRASYLSGGEFPVLIPTDDINAVHVEWCEFGTHLEVRPLILSDGKLRLEIDSRFSQLDYDGVAGRFAGGGIPVPGIRVQNFHLQLELEFGQTAAIAGMRTGRSANEKHTIVLIRCEPADDMPAPLPTDEASPDE